MARVKSIFGGRKRLEAGVGGGAVESFTMVEESDRKVSLRIQTKLAHSQSHDYLHALCCQG